MSRRAHHLRGLLAALLVPALGGDADAVAAGRHVVAPHAIAVESRPITAFSPAEPSRTRFGALEFLGGLELSSRDPAFGGLSGLRTRDHGRELIAVSDEGIWFVARLATDAAGRPGAITDARVASLRDAAGRPFGAKSARDAESLTLHAGGPGLEVRVGFEGWDRVLAYASPDGTAAGLLEARGHPIALPPDLGNFRPNGGMEAIAEPVGGGPLVAFGEWPRAGETTNPGWIVGGPRPGLFHVATVDGHAVTDAAFLADGDLLLLQRRFGLIRGFAMRLVRIPAADIRPGATATGELLLAADHTFEIDNMEGLAVDTAPDGSTILTLVSDDNYFALQRTVLLRFRLAPASGKTPPG